MVVAIVIPFTLTLIVGKIRLSGEERYGKEAADAAEAAQDAQAAEIESNISDTSDENSAAADVKELKSILDGKVMPVDRGSG